ncbi:hypothetical protein [Nocardia camponoti]|uniref:Uncharacterized protein n=1 Tax=Nocardia camponoti TaxID=1616106 RepID=A0A917QS63_9NOCA|nr:hypothetical protein [Nocardia camponoti]GGK65652.1 hypothetical protein GCM10011591_42300 [Nocardia camponoti]
MPEDQRTHPNRAPGAPIANQALDVLRHDGYDKEIEEFNPEPKFDGDGKPLPASALTGGSARSAVNGILADANLGGYTGAYETAFRSALTERLYMSGDEAKKYTEGTGNPK